MSNEFCGRGHEFTPENTYWANDRRKPSGRKRQCRACGRLRKSTLYERERGERARRRSAKVEEWKRDISAADLAWAAGHFEGEGTISIGSIGRGGYARPLATLASTDREVIDLFSAWWPSSTPGRAPRVPSPNARPVYRWEITSAIKVRAFIDQIRPHLRTERCKAKFDLVGEFTDKVLEAHQGKVKARHPEYVDAIRRLNHRGQSPAPEAR